MQPEPLSSFDPSEGTPVTIVIATFGFRKTVGRWIDFASQGACDHWRIVCMDWKLAAWLGGQGLGIHVVDYFNVFPDAPRVDFDALPRKERMRALMPARTRLFLHLARTGRDFIHSDADAFWLGDPRPWLGAQDEFDLVFSQGTIFPKEQYLRHRFVLCAGFFLCRANTRTEAYFEQVEALSDCMSDDQWRMNTVLLRDPQGRWEVRNPVNRIQLPRVFWRRVPRLAGAAIPSVRRLLGPGLARLPHGVARRLPECVVTSHEPIRGTFGNGLTVGVIPMHLVVRMGVTPASCAFVVHGGSTRRTAPGPIESRALREIGG